jgi:hypothetical protein
MTVLWWAWLFVLGWAAVTAFWFLVYTSVKLARLAYLSANRQFENDHQPSRRPVNGQGKRTS